MTGHYGLLGEPGKRARVVSVEPEVLLATQPFIDLSRGEVLGCDGASSKDEVKLSDIMCTLDMDMYLAHSESIVIDLYCLGSKDEQWNSVPFQHTIKLNSPKGEVVQLKSTFNDGAMTSAVDLQTFQNIKHHLDPLQRLNHILRMADGRLVPSMGSGTEESLLARSPAQEPSRSLIVKEPGQHCLGNLY